MYHFLKEVVEDNLLHLKYVSTYENATDFLTKAVAAEKHYLCANVEGLEAP